MKSLKSIALEDETPFKIFNFCETKITFPDFEHLIKLKQVQSCCGRRRC